MRTVSAIPATGGGAGAFPPVGSGLGLGNRGGNQRGGGAAAAETEHLAGTEGGGFHRRIGSDQGGGADSVFFGDAGVCLTLADRVGFAAACSAPGRWRPLAAAAAELLAATLVPGTLSFWPGWMMEAGFNPLDLASFGGAGADFAGDFFDAVAGFDRCRWFPRWPAFGFRSGGVRGLGRGFDVAVESRGRRLATVAQLRVFLLQLADLPFLLRAERAQGFQLGFRKRRWTLQESW